VRQALEDGALGVSFGLGYVPGIWANTDELIEVARDVPNFGGRITVHMRGQTVFIERAVKEMIRVAETVGAPLQLSHFVPYDADFTGQFFAAYQATEEAQARGVKIGYDLLPYAVASTTSLMLYPPWMFEGGMPVFFERLKDRKIRARLVDEFRNRQPEWPTWETNSWPDNRYSDEEGWGNHRLYGFRKPEHQHYEGLNLEAIAEDMGKDPFEALFDLTLAEEGRLYHTSGHHDDEGYDMAMGLFLKLPHMAFMTDAVGIGHRSPHPSHYGAFPRFMGRHVREWETFTLEQAVRKSTSLPAEQLGLPNRGIIRQGAHADIVVFDPKRITDKASFAKPYRYSEGVHSVIINGVPVWHEGHYRAGAPSGHVIRRA
jgi:N-acyl-D-amino-acid deacylase